MRKGRYNNNPHIYVKFHAFKSGEGGKVSWKLRKISLSAKHSFYSFSSFEESVAFQNGESQVSVGQNKCVHLGFFLQTTETFFAFDQYDSLKNFGVQSVQLHTMPCHSGQDPG